MSLDFKVDVFIILADGFVVANDIDFRINYRWSQGTNVFFTHEDAKKFPDLYTTEDVSLFVKWS